ncbi:MAG: M36 family metallopeptidase, partial [Betaproteobacteria bacterium]|nr:M36 family metallopeptidase [Betaproteobacteria bacterium]
TRALATAHSAEEAARGHLKQVAGLYQLSAAEIDAAPLHYTESLYNGAQLAKFNNQLAGIEVFRESATVLMDAQMRPLAIGGYIGPTGANTASSKSAQADTSRTFRLSPAEAIAAALGDYGFTPQIAEAMQRLAGPAGVTEAATSSKAVTEPTDPYQYFTLPTSMASRDGARMSEPTRIKPVWFRLATGLVPAYYLELQMNDRQAGDGDYYSYVIAADDGRLLFRNNLVKEVAYTYRVWAENSGINLPLPGPQGRNGTPHPTGRNDGYQPPFVLQNDITLQNGPISTNDPWLPPNATRTIGNNVDAWANLFAPAAVPPDTTAPPDGFEAAPDECNLSSSQPGDFHACLSGTNAFTYTYDPTQGAKASKRQSVASVVNLFYLNNWLHDWYYDVGFKEINGNAQSSNYGRGGFGNDPIRAQAQDVSGTNNANMSTPADGARPRMRMYVFTGSGAGAVLIPPSLTRIAGTADFGPTNFNVSGNIVAVDDGVSPETNGCEPITNPVAGAIALIDRGSCTFKSKVLNAQNAGAIGVIIVNNVAGGVNNMANDESISEAITIPVLMVTLADGDVIKPQLLAGVISGSLRRVVGVDRDGTLDNLIIAHEWGHYISNRLIGNANGLNTDQANGLGEGWADFHALLMAVKAEDAQVAANANFNGTYADAPYAVDGPQLSGITISTAYYSGFRRYPYSTDLSKNPLTFKHFETGVALPTSPAPAFTGNNAEVHNAGEIWASMLWGCYAALLRDTPRLSFAQAQDRMKRYLVASYKLTPNDPTLIEARDALFAAIAANDLTDLQRCREAFAVRGAGSGAQSGDRNSPTNAGVVESFAAAPEPLNYSDMWWGGNAENGWGMSIQQHTNNVQFNALYVYDNQGLPRWYVMPGGTWNPGFTSYTGLLYQPTSSPFSAYSANQLVVGPSVGNLTINYTSSSTATINYTINGVSAQKSIMRQVFGSGAAPFDANDLWWGGSVNAAEGGWGVNIAQQQGTLFVVWYTYGADGRVKWFVMPGGNWSGNSYTGMLYETTSSAWLGVAYNPAALQVLPVGSMTLDFAGISNG